MANKIFEVCQHKAEIQKTNIDFIKSKLIQEIVWTEDN